MKDGHSGEEEDDDADVADVDDDDINKGWYYYLRSTRLNSYHSPWPFLRVLHSLAHDDWPCPRFSGDTLNDVTTAVT